MCCVFHSWEYCVAYEYMFSLTIKTLKKKNTFSTDLQQFILFNHPCMLIETIYKNDSDGECFNVLFEININRL